jgi:hypothetical protein
MRARAGTGDSRQTLNRCYEIATTSPDFGLKTIVSGIAAVLTTAAFVPQAYKIIQSRETEGVSLWMHIILRGGRDVLVCAWGDALELADDARERGDFHTNVHQSSQ